MSGHERQDGAEGTRREMLAGALATSAMLVAGCDRSSSAATRAASSAGADEQPRLQRLIDAGDLRIEARPEPYRLLSRLIVPAGRTLTIEGGTRLRYEGAVDPEAPGVLIAAGNDVRIIAVGGEAIVESPRAAPELFAVAARGVAGLEVSGIRGQDCQHVVVEGSTKTYSDVVTSGPAANVSRGIRIRGGGARFSVPTAGGRGACSFWYVFDWELSGASYENVQHGVEWWGGDSNTSVNGARGNERKCGSFRITGVRVLRAAQGGIWGSMGRDGIIADCQVRDCGDVGIDPEGCNDITIRSCTSEDGRNGCFATFYLNDTIRFVDCVGRASSRTMPLFRMFNSTLDGTDNRDVAIVGGRYVCTDPAGPSTIDTASGPARDFRVEGAALENVRIDTAHHNMHRTVIARNTLRFAALSPGLVAISAGASRATAADDGASVAGGVEITENRLLVDRPASGGSETIGIAVREDDFNAAARGTVARNTIAGAFATAITVTNASRNSGIVPAFAIRDNVVDGPAGRIAVRTGSPQARPALIEARDNHAAGGRALTMVEAG